MNIEREWARVPPRWVRETGGALHPFTLGDLVGDFNQRRGDPSSPLHRNRDDIVDWCAEQESDAQAIIIACESKRRNGKLHNHQSRVAHEAGWNRTSSTCTLAAWRACARSGKPACGTTSSSAGSGRYRRVTCRPN
jgi:hypothetical protein